ncbi:hypothetical protein QBC41DRAFT_39090 [Cercophora samala]|uniref:Uncharacterized protein n=1 Tax=Cercophora samala TaxID=330535 RepID=A0AA39ZJ61_9PEZI|nr:hypothetical protein QBC41DRAFT_39090 [Cercophora samala]
MYRFTQSVPARPPALPTLLSLHCSLQCMYLDGVALAARDFVAVDFRGSLACRYSCVSCTLRSACPPHYGQRCSCVPNRYFVDSTAAALVAAHMDLGEVSLRPSALFCVLVRHCGAVSRHFPPPLHQATSLSSVHLSGCPGGTSPPSSGDIPQSAAEVDESSCPFPLPVYLQNRAHWPSAVPFLPPFEKGHFCIQTRLLPRKNPRARPQIGPKQKGRAEGVGQVREWRPEQGQA